MVTNTLAINIWDKLHKSGVVASCASNKGSKKGFEKIKINHIEALSVYTGYLLVTSKKN